MQLWTHSSIYHNQLKGPDHPLEKVMVSLFKFALFVIIIGVAIAENRATGPFRALTTRNLVRVQNAVEKELMAKIVNDALQPGAVKEVLQDVASKIEGLKNVPNLWEAYDKNIAAFKERLINDLKPNYVFGLITGKKYGETSLLAVSDEHTTLYQLYCALSKKVEQEMSKYSIGKGYLIN
ncbi:uncharacterized protein PHALS_01564 [Plasmopara halstedii]|uniref:RxLR-like protein n=1 Tax=Plasmopara halstedii TaxID=4781 RepID=A0A0P1AV18_PLAHL|nr:uncharacterized protein PHALS_01564 [Plasmopara halstedii]CEG45255.1 hypothetical protein PHALS_01564 [Plasmopara halstedii]|eukprot:XP_024581624.1 hypothetical protein PHALS_01564 [Plasmopara halstedii]